MSKPILTTVDAFPGSGKTHLFKEIALRSLADPDYPYVLLYVAPTKLLCEEVYSHFVKHSQPDALERIYRVWSTEEEELDKMLDQSFKKSVKKVGPVAKLNSYLGTSPKAIPLAPGNVVITTHETFMRVKNVPTAYKTWVFFDEARECVGLKEHISIPKVKVQKCLDLFKAVEVKHESTSTDKEPSKVYKLTAAPSLENMQSLFTISQLTSRRGPKGLHDLVKSTDSNRTSLYVLVPNKADQTSLNVTVYPFNNPVALFDNYFRVTVMSAFFKDSQMYHALHPYYRIIPLVNYPKNEDVVTWIRDLRYIALVIAKRNKRLEKNTGNRLNIVPILYNKEDEDLKSTLQIDKSRSVQRLTKTTLTTGMIVDIATAQKVKRFVEQHRLDWNSKRTVLEVWRYWFAMLRNTEHHEQPVTSKALKEKYLSRWAQDNPEAKHEDVVPQLFEMLKPYMFDPKGEIVFPARLLVARAKVLSKRAGADHPPLLIFNSNLGSKMHYLTSDYKTPSPKGNLFWVEPLVPNTTLALRERYKKSFEIPNTPRLNGLNTWAHTDHMVHMAALNPPNELVSVFRRILPDYDVAYDFLLENVVQTLYRTSLRDPKIKDRPVFLYIIRATLTRLLMLKVKKVFNVDFYLEDDDVRLTELDFVSAVTKERQYEKSSQTQRVHDEATSKRLKQLRPLLHKYKNMAAFTPKQEARYKELKKELKTLTTISKGL